MRGEMLPGVDREQRNTGWRHPVDKRDFPLCPPRTVMSERVY
jgi:hypothetical protein